MERWRGTIYEEVWRADILAIEAQARICRNRWHERSMPDGNECPECGEDWGPGEMAQARTEALDVETARKRLLAIYGQTFTEYADSVDDILRILAAKETP